jgi:tetratricopeptide (TPR) repeat protein
MKIAARFLVVAGLLAGVAGSPAIANAQSAPASQAAKDEAQERFKRGIALYEEEAFPAALVEFRRAYELVPAYQVLYNVARSCYQVRDYVCALRTFERYLADGGAGIDAHRREEVDRELASMRRRIVTLNVKSTKGATIFVDGVAAGDFPLAAPLVVNEGRRQVRATMAGHDPVEKMVDLVGGETTPVDLTISDSGGAVAATPKSSSTTHYWLWGATGVLAVGAGVTGALALGASSNASDIRTTGGSLSDYDSAQSRMRSMTIVTDVLGIAAIGMGITALVVTLSQPDSKASTTGSLKRSPTGGLLHYGL